MSERVIFDAALEIADPQARRAFIEKSCAGKPGMLAAVETLLKSHDEVGSFLNVPIVEQRRPAPASASDSVDSSKSSEVFHKTRIFQSRTQNDDDSDDETQPDLSFLRPSSKPGSIGLLGHYEVLKMLGQGGFGIVLKAFDEKLHRLVAIKVMNAQMAATSAPRKRFLREARAAAAMRHENLVQVHSVEELPLPYLVMEFIDGQTLKQKIDGAGPLEVPEVLHIGRQIASGLAAAQAMGLIHRDIKPGNILLEHGAEQRVKITDFGLARAADDASLTRSGTISGTPMYMAPEQALGRALDHRADLFSLGSVLYELTCGRPPFRAASTVAVLRRVAEDTPRPMQEIIPETPDWLVAIVTKLLAKKPEDRFQTAKEVAELLARCQTELQTTGKVTCVKVDESLRDSNVSSRSDEPTKSSEPKVDRSLRDRNPSSHGVTRLLSRRPLLIAAAAVVLILVAAIVARRGNDTKSEISNLKSQISSPPGQADSTDSTNPDVRAAEWVLSIGGTVQINGQERLIGAVGDLPDGAFELTRVVLSANPKVNDAGLAHFKDCKNITYLDLIHTSVSDAGLAHFKDCKNLTHLSLEDTRVTDAGLAHFKDCKNINYLNPSGTKVSDAGLAHFKDCKNLTGLNLTYTSVSDAGLAHFKECQNLTVLFLQGLRVSDAGLAHFRDCKNLTQLNLIATLVSDAGLAHFQDCKNLTDLRLESTQVSDAALGVLAGLPNLTSLHLANSRISLRGHEQLKADLPKCQIIWSETNRSLAESVLALGGTVEIGSRDKPESRPIQFPSELPATYFQIRRVSLVGVTKPLGTLPDQLSWLRFPEFDRLESLDLSGIPLLGGYNYGYLAPIHGLRDLSLGYPMLTDQNSHTLGLVKQVKRLSLAGSGLTDAGIKRLADLTNLESLDLRRTKVTAAGIDELKAALPKCKIEWDGGVIDPSAG